MSHICMLSEMLLRITESKFKWLSSNMTLNFGSSVSSRGERERGREGERERGREGEREREE